MPTLKKIQKEIESCLLSPLPPLLVFDLDSTLFDVSPRIRKILLNFAKDPTHQKLFPEATQTLNEIELHRKDWGILEALQRIGLDHRHPEFLHSVHNYWHTHFFSNEALLDDVPYPGAVEFVKKFHQMGANTVMPFRMSS
jgi:FMN phosphatase YigB (HAD superfamily)